MYIIIIVLPLVVVGAGILRQRDVAQVLPDVFGVSVTGTTTAGIPASKGTPTSLPPQVLSEGMRTYKNRYHGFELVYPAELQVQEYAEDDGSRTILFESATLETGFQIYITSYGGTNVTREQFLKDQPSGVYDQPTDIWVDGVPAIMFFGENSLMGETREVWFIHNGFLYEVTTYKPLDTWLGAIMQSWKFL